MGVTLLNTNAGAKAQRLLPCIMKNFVENGTTLEIATFDSDACSHDEMDEKQKSTIQELKDLEELVLQFAAAKLTNKVNPYNIQGSIPQKIVKDVPMPKGLIPYEE